MELCIVACASSRVVIVEKSTIVMSDFFLSNLPEATIRSELEEIVVLTVRDGRLILRVIIAVVAISRAIARLLLHICT